MKEAPTISNAQDSDAIIYEFLIYRSLKALFQMDLLHRLIFYLSLEQENILLEFEIEYQ